NLAACRVTRVTELIVSRRGRPLPQQRAEASRRLGLRPCVAVLLSASSLADSAINNCGDPVRDRCPVLRLGNEVCRRFAGDLLPQLVLSACRPKPYMRLDRLSPFA